MLYYIITPKTEMYCILIYIMSMHGLKPKSKQVLDIIAQNPKISATDAYLRVHKTENRSTAADNAYQLLRKPSAQIYMEKHVSKATNTIVDLMDSEKDDIRLRASVDVLDRIHGKATQRTEVTSTGITLNIDLTSSLDITE